VIFFLSNFFFFHQKPFLESESHRGRGGHGGLGGGVSVMAASESVLLVLADGSSGNLDRILVVDLNEGNVVDSVDDDSLIGEGGEHVGLSPVVVIVRIDASIQTSPEQSGGVAEVTEVVLPAAADGLGVGHAVGVLLEADWTALMVGIAGRAKGGGGGDAKKIV